MRDVFDNFAVDVFPTSPRLRRTSGELHGSLSSAGGAHPAAFAGECDKQRVLTSVAVYPSGTVSEDSAVKVLVEGLSHLIP
jgi:hypothetical protein